MPRIRTVKPAYPKNRKTRKVCRDARLLNIHLWNLADDEGRLQELPLWIIGEVFPTDEDVTPAVLRGWLEELADAKMIVRYEVDGEHYIQCHDFNDHQRIEKPKRSEIPSPQADSEDPSVPSGSDPGSIQDESRPEEEGKRKGEKEEEGGGDTPPPDHLAAVFTSLEQVAFKRQITSPRTPATAKACEDFPDRDLEAEASNFAHYWTEGPGEKRDLKDIAWAWRNWLKKADAAEPKVTKAPDRFSKYDAMVEAAG